MIPFNYFVRVFCLFVMVPPLSSRSVAAAFVVLLFYFSTASDLCCGMSKDGVLFTFLPAASVFIFLLVRTVHKISFL
jgi:hypothetical protein